MEKVKIDIPNRVYDSSCLNDWLSCPRRFFWKHIKEYRPKDIAIPLSFGSGVHSALEAWAQGVPEDDCIIAFAKDFAECGKEDAKRSMGSGDDLLRAYFAYWQHPLPYLKKEDGSPMTEIEFSFPLGEITLVGRIDGIIEENGIWVVDHKTTSSITRDVAVYKRSLQNRLYFCAATNILSTKNVPVVGCVMDFLFVSGAKKKDYTQAFARQEYPMSSEMAELLFDQIVVWDRMIQAMLVEKGTSTCWVERFPECHYFNECPYTLLCEFPERAEEIAKSQFV